MSSPLSRVRGVLDPVVSRAWLAEHCDPVVLADVRRNLDVSAEDAFAEGHLPGAVLVDLDRWLADAPSPEQGRHPLPPPARFAEGMSLAGIGDGSRVVAYDDAGGVIAARLVWMLRAVGHPAALLDGALTGDDPLEPGPVSPAAAEFTPRPWPAELLADADDALDARNVVLDARPRERFHGAEDPLDPRPGHVPRARSTPARESLSEEGLLLPLDVLRDRFAAAGVTSEGPVVAYCGSGVTACHTLLVMEHVGLGSGRLYPGSWSQYAADPDRPVELD